METWLIIALLMGSFVVLLALGLPIVFAIGGVAVGGLFFLEGPAALNVVAIGSFAKMTDYILLAVPMFVFMANMLERSGIADSLYEVTYRWSGPVRGGLAMATVISCTVIAAMSGVVAAGVVTMGVVALPQMLKRNYNTELALGSIAAGGALGQLIPPSVMMVILGMQAQISVGKLFMGGIMPGLVLSGLFIIYIAVISIIRPNLAPSLPREERPTLTQKLISTRGVILPVLLVASVLGSIYLGLASVTEASAVGAFGAVVCAAINRKLTWKDIKEATRRTLPTTCMVMWIFFAGSAMSTLFMFLKLTPLLEGWFASIIASVGVWGVIAVIQLIWILMGCFLDPVAIVMITVPLFFPIINSLGLDQVWFGVIFMVNIQIGILTPPFGHSLFYMKGVVPPGITMGQIYRSVVPFIICQIIGLVLVIMFPQIATWLPAAML